MSNTVKHRKTIQLNVGLDEKNVPVEITWSADDTKDYDQEQTAKAMLVSIFDKEHRDTLKIDLWTKEMQVIEMDRFFYQTLKSLADTYFRATQNTKLANRMREFAEHFGEETEIVPKQ